MCIIPRTTIVPTVTGLEQLTGHFGRNVRILPAQALSNVIYDSHCILVKERLCCQHPLALQRRLHTSTVVYPLR